MSRAVPLVGLPSGAAGVVVGCGGGHGIVSRLAAMGFTPGSRVTVISNHNRGPILVMVHGSRIALGRGEAAKILVCPAGGSDDG